MGTLRDDIVQQLAIQRYINIHYPKQTHFLIHALMSFSVAYIHEWTAFKCLEDLKATLNTKQKEIARDFYLNHTKQVIGDLRIMEMRGAIFTLWNLFELYIYDANKRLSTPTKITARTNLYSVYHHIIDTSDKDESAKKTIRDIITTIRLTRNALHSDQKFTGKTIEYHYFLEKRYEFIPGQNVELINISNMITGLLKAFEFIEEYSNLKERFLPSQSK